ncbi:MAG: AraC family transcriptional regulator [Bacteriovoracaceae bacterium]|nr:AraC family transcriptional regulator [Bacteriovoracaceae bacterium]
MQKVSSPVLRALWFVENHSNEPISLSQISDSCGVSPYHLTRAFAAATGIPLMKYVRARRLSEAAKKISQNSEGILSVAIESGYNSHEAFTRAFGKHFHCTPEQVVSQGHTEKLALTEALTLHPTTQIEITKPRFEMLEAGIYAGIAVHYDCDDLGGIPNQWQKAMPFLEEISTRVGHDLFGICYNYDEAGFVDYMCAAEVKSSHGLPRELTAMSVDKQLYAVFLHQDHISEIRVTIGAVWNQWFPYSGYGVVEGPMFERYDQRFDTVTGLGGVEIWMPVVKINERRENYDDQDT